MSPTLASLIAATDGIHARDPSTLDRLDASTASKRTPSSVVAALAFETSFFETHVAYAVERDDEREDGGNGDVYADADDEAEVVHVFTLKDKVRERLTRALTPLALRKFRRGREDEARSLGGAVPGPGSDVSVVRSNRGGYQSYADLLDSDSEDEVSDAVDAAEDDVPNRPPSWTVVNAIALEAYARVKRDSQRDDVTARDVYGWLNVNAPGDYNKLHAHDSADRWSGVLYLATPSAMTTTTIDDDDDDERDEQDAGALGIRGNTTARPHHTGTDSTRERDAERPPAAASTTPYFVHAPTPGDLVVFTGAALHAVAPFRATTKTTSNTDPPDDHDAGPSDDVLRVSVAFNVDC